MLLGLQFGNLKSLNLHHGNKELRTLKNITKMDTNAFNKWVISEHVLNDFHHLVSKNIQYLTN